ncbi:hypothetical protein PV327_002092 [Microctonus hyperodae]|uniref:Uncharacterized protein n=1 Tax=Microctonus hyperodae TaxID=165561 RepID=A0AA39FF05_MICHY|nr:hypothetical protein PV327_002092 [Microctonus hyperodae]
MLPLFRGWMNTCWVKDKENEFEVYVMVHQNKNYLILFLVFTITLNITAMGQSLNTLSVRCAENKYIAYTPATELSPSTLTCLPCPLEHKCDGSTHVKCPDTKQIFLLGKCRSLRFNNKKH